MRFLTDLNIESQIIRRLREDDHDVRSAAEDFLGAPDEAVLAALNSEDRVLITNDKDFAELAYLQRKASTGIVLVRMARSSSREKARRVAEVVGEMGQRLASAMTVSKRTQCAAASFRRSPRREAGNGSRKENPECEDRS